MAANVIESIHKVLVEFETHPRELENLCFLTFSDVPDIREKLDFSGPSAAYVTHLIKVLSSYGRLPDNTHALVKLLEAVKAHWGVDKQARIDELIEEFEQFCADSPPPRAPQTLLPIGPNPYRGLQAFREEDADLFFRARRLHCAVSAGRARAPLDGRDRRVRQRQVLAGVGRTDPALTAAGGTGR